jgi:hypothetical protein
VNGRIQRLSVGKCGVFGVRRPEENEPAAALAGEFRLAGFWWWISSGYLVNQELNKRCDQWLEAIGFI